MYVFNLNNLKPFDIILVRYPQDRLSNIIRKRCNSNYSHAIIYLGDGSFIEAFEPIGVLFSSSRYYFNNLENIKVLRLSHHLYNSFDLDNAEESLRSLIYCDYSSDLLSYVKDRKISIDVIDKYKNFKKWTGGIVCSSLVTLPYFDGGIDLSGNNEPYYAHFHHIENFHGFEDITDVVFTKTSEVLEGSFDYFSSIPTGSILEKQSVAVSKLNAVVKDIFIEYSLDNLKLSKFHQQENLIYSNWEDVLPYLIDIFNTKEGEAIDNKFYQTIVETEYNNLWFEEVHNNRLLFFPYYYYSSSFSSTPLINEPLEYFQCRMNSIKRYSERIQLMLEKVSKAFIHCPSKTIHTLLTMYTNYQDLLINSINQYEVVIDEICGED